MEKNKTAKIWVVVVVAAVVAALTAIAVYVLRARAKKKYLCNDEDYDFTLEEEAGDCDFISDEADEAAGE